MNKRDALRLKPGDEILFGDHQFVASCGSFWSGEVLFVSRNGGIRVRLLDGRPWTGAKAWTKEHGHVERWVPYHHVVRATARKPIERAVLRLK